MENARCYFALLIDNKKGGEKKMENVDNEDRRFCTLSIAAQPRSRNHKMFGCVEAGICASI